MARYRRALPQSSGKLFLTDGGLETELCFLDRMELPCFAAFPLLESKAGRDRLRRYFGDYAVLAQQHQVGLILESPTWRANRDWGRQLGYDAQQLVELNQRAIALLEKVRADYETDDSPMVISGCMGSNGDGYNPDNFMEIIEAEEYHRDQVRAFEVSGADMVAPYTMSYVEEAVGIVCAAQAANMPIAVSFTVETDGTLPSGTPLKAAIEQVDAATESAPVYYMVNCAHPTHVAEALTEAGRWRNRIKGLRANASCKSHAELDASEVLDDGDPLALAQDFMRMRAELPALNVVGGCCGTDTRHIAAICTAWLGKND